METVPLPLFNEHLERVTVGDVNIYKHMLPQLVFPHSFAAVLRLFLSFK